MNISDYIECRDNKFFRTVEQTGLHLILLRLCFYLFTLHQFLRRDIKYLN